MIKLRNCPIEGSAVRLNLSFKDAFGNYYVPTYVTYTLLALNSDEESWSIVDDIYKTVLEPASAITLITPKCSIISDTTLTRKILVEWTAYVDGTYTDFVDEVLFEVQPKPYVPDAPDSSDDSTVYVKISSITLQTGSSIAAPTQPVFIVKTNIPSKTSSATINVTDSDSNVTDCNIEVDSTNTVFTITPINQLEGTTSYTLNISGMTSVSGGYEMESDFSYSFVTTSASKVQTSKEVEITENGSVTVSPDEDYTSMESVVVTVNVSEETIALYAYANSDFNVTYWSNKEITESGDYTILTSGETVNFVDYAVTVENDTISFEKDGKTIVITRLSDSDILK